MNVRKIDFTPEQETCNSSVTDMINTLSYLCSEAENAKLELVSLHLNIAFDELMEHHLKSMSA